MTGWTRNDLERIGAADELRLASVKKNGAPRKPVIIWVVRHGDDLYIRAWRGRTATWFRGAQDCHDGHIRAGGIDKDVLFIDADATVNDAIDAAYRTKYHRYGARYVDPMVAPAARAATIKLVPRATT